MNTLRPILNGEPCFGVLRKGGYEYVDKTALVYALTHSEKYVFLSRPKRFGKSMLCYTLKSYFRGERALFEGLAMERLENEWRKHEVIHFDFNSCVTVGELRNRLRDTFEPLEAQYQLPERAEDTYGARFLRLLRVASKATGCGVAVIVDEYDYTLQQTWGDEAAQESVRALMRSVFDILKSCSEELRFVFITGIARFKRTSLLSSLNHLTDISFQPQYQGLCGVTQAELDGPLRGHVEKLAAGNGWTTEEAYGRLKEYYDGYHFCAPEGATPALDMYNPYSLFRCFSSGKVRKYWNAANSQELSNFVPDLRTALECYEGAKVTDMVLESNDVGAQVPALYFYQVGLLTIRSYDEGCYTLRYANTEVREAIAETTLTALWLPDASDAQAQSVWQMRQQRLQDFKSALLRRDIAQMGLLLSALLSDFPYGPVPRRSMKAEERSRDFTMTLVASVNIPYEREYHTDGGVVDLVLYTPRYIYVLEYKTRRRGGAAAGCEQIARQGYLEAFRGMRREVVGLGVGVPDRGKGRTELREVG